MSTPILFPDVELVLTGYLRGALPDYGYADVPVGIRRTTAPTEVWVRRDGGPALDQVREGARVGVNVFAPKEQDATDLARTVSALLRAAAGTGPILRVTQGLGPSPIADATPRRYMTFECVVRGIEL